MFNIAPLEHLPESTDQTLIQSVDKLTAHNHHEEDPKRICSLIFEN